METPVKQREVAIIGAGITGLLAGYMLHTVSPDTTIKFVDAGPDPQSAEAGQNHGATLGQSRDARHITGTEGLSFQNPIHTRLLSEPASLDSPGWQTIPRDQLSMRELAWRSEAVTRYHSHVTTDHNPYDEMYTMLNYGGLAAWRLLTALNPALATYRTHQDGVYVAFSSDAELAADLQMETKANPNQGYSPVTTEAIDVLQQGDATFAINALAQQVLHVPGETWRIKSVWQHLYQELQPVPNVQFEWDTPIQGTDKLPSANSYIWAAGSGYALPDFYREYSKVQGIGGWWLSLQNPGFQVPFKFSAPQPSGYMNFTPDGDVLHISGGFGWTGERVFEEAVQLLEPVKQHFLTATGNFLGMTASELAMYKLGCCIRPTTTTGLPELANPEINGRQHIMLSGAGKAGATQAPLLALHAVSEIIGYEPVDSLVARFTDLSGQLAVKHALALAQAGFEPTGR